MHGALYILVVDLAGQERLDVCWDGLFYLRKANANYWYWIPSMYCGDSRNTCRIWGIRGSEKLSSGVVGCAQFWIFEWVALS